MRNIIGVVLLVVAVALGTGIRQNQGPKPDAPCKSCVVQGPKTEVPCRACVVQGPKPNGPCRACVAINARNQAIIDADLRRGHVAHVGGVPVN
jgi:hypothetical protein